jgi:autotransporter-associated beta strand protein
MRRAGLLQSACWVLPILMVGMLPAMAATVYWDTSTDSGLQPGSGVWDVGASALWSSSTSGSNPLLTFASGDDAVFAAPGTSAVTIANAGVTANSVAFSAGATGYTIAGGSNPLILGAAGGTGITADESAVISANVALGADQAWAVGTSATLTVSGIVSGSGLTKTGAGRLTLKGANNYTGNTTLDAGALRAEGTNAGTLGTGASELVLNSGTLESYADTTSTINYGRNVTVNGDTTILLGRVTTGSETTAATRQFGTLSIGNAKLTPRLDGTTFSAASVSANLNFGDTTLTGDATFDLSNFRKGSNYGILTLTSLTDNGGGHGLTLLGPWYYMRVRVTGNTNIAGDVVLGNNSQGPDLRIDNYTPTSLAGNLNFRGGVLSVNADVTRDLGTGAGEVQFTGGTQNGFTNHTANRITVTIGDGAGGAAQLQWNTALFNPGALVLAGRSAGTGGVTLANAIDLNGSLRTFYNYGSSATAELPGLISNSGTSAAGIRQHNNSSGTTYLQNNANSFNGPVTVQGGAIRFDTIGNIGGGPTALGDPTAGTAVITLGHSTETRLYTGTLLYSGSDALTTNRPIRINGNGTIRSIGTGTITFSADMAAPTAYNRVMTFTLGGTNTGDNTFAGKILDRSAESPTPVVKADAGTWVLSGDNPYTGATTINAGVLKIAHANALGSTDAGTAVASGATLGLQGGIVTAAEALTLNGAGAASAGALRNYAGDNTYSGPITLAGTTVRINSDSGTLTLTGGLNASGSHLVVGGAGDTMIASTLGTGLGNLAKDGDGTLTLAAACAYGGTTTISGGTLRLADSDNRIPVTSALSINPTSATATAATLDLGTTNQTVPSLAFGGTGARAGVPMSVVGAGTLALGGNVTYASTNNPAGAAIAANLNLGNATRTFSVGNSTAVADDLTISGIVSGDSGVGLTKTGAGTLVLSNAANSYTGATTLNGGVLSVAALANGGSPSSIGASSSAQENLNFLTHSTFRYTGGTVVTDRRFTFASGQTGTFDITQSDTELTLVGRTSGGSGYLTKTGPGTLILSGANTYIGTTTVNAGTLRLGSAGSLAAGSYGLRILPTTSGVDAVMDLNNRNWTVTYTGTFNLTFGGNGAAAGSNMLLSTGTGTITLNNAAAVVTYNATNNPNGAVFSGNLNLGGVTRTFNIGDSSAAEDDLTVSAAISGGSGAGLMKDGDGTLTLSGHNTYSGPTTVSAGRLLVHGSHTGGDAYTVQGGATLGGAGSIGSVVDVNAGGRLAPGASIGTLAIGGNLALAGGSIFEWEFNSDKVTADLLNLDGDLNLDPLGGVSLDLTDLADPVRALAYGTRLTMISYSGDWNGGIFDGYANNSKFFSGLNEWKIRYDDLLPELNGVSFANFVTLTIVPEPTSLVLLIGAMLGLTFRRCRQRRNWR